VTQIEVDARGLRCPLPVIRLAAAAQVAAAGTLIVVLATDPAARHDIPAWCRMRDHELREVTDVTETNETNETNETAKATGVTPADTPASKHPAYLRFVVALRAHPPNAAGAGTSRARWSRAT
jgi:tRNA 2-thiouridine synthesizing protein A